MSVVKERLGHGSIETTAGYFHTLPTADDTALAALDAIRTARPAPSSDVDGPSAPAVRAVTTPPADLSEALQMMAELKDLMQAIAS